MSRWTPGLPAHLCIRPHEIEVTAVGAQRSLRARVTTSVWRGASTRLTLAVDGLPDQLIDADVAGRADHPVDEVVGVRLPDPAGTLVDTAGGPR